MRAIARFLLRRHCPHPFTLFNSVQQAFRSSLLVAHGSCYPARICDFPAGGALARSVDDSIAFNCGAAHCLLLAVCSPFTRFVRVRLLYSRRNAFGMCSIQHPGPRSAVLWILTVCSSFVRWRCCPPCFRASPTPSTLSRSAARTLSIPSRTSG